MTISISTEKQRDFCTDFRLRLKQTIIFAFQLAFICFGTYALLSLLFNHTIRFHYFSSVIFVLWIAWMCYRYTSWGNRLQIGKMEIVLLRGNNVTYKVLLNSLKQVKIHRMTVTFVHTEKGHLKYKLIGRVGFSEAGWQEFTQYVKNQVKPQIRA